MTNQTKMLMPLSLKKTNVAEEPNNAVAQESNESISKESNHVSTEESN